MRWGSRCGRFRSPRRQELVLHSSREIDEVGLTLWTLSESDILIVPSFKSVCVYVECFVRKCVFLGG
jgi:hypothetical protein